MLGSGLGFEHHRFGEDYAKLGKYDGAAWFRSMGAAFSLAQSPSRVLRLKAENIVIYDHSK
jgi:hypothetical protein